MSRTTTGICIECALHRHDFREVIGAPENSDALPMMRLPQALIDGKSHVLLFSSLTHQEHCVDCGRKTTNLYVPTR